MISKSFNQSFDQSYDQSESKKIVDEKIDEITTIVINKKHIVLDLDGTLICDDSMSTDVVGMARPHLEKFLHFLFTDPRVASVRIWTIASREWWDQVYRSIIKPLLPNGKNFVDIWTGSDKIRRFTLKYDFEYQIMAKIKPLKKYWRRKSNHMNKKNTIIIDNTSSTYLHNRGNGIAISTYVHTHFSNDDELLFMIKDLDKRLLNLYDVRNRQILNIL